MRWLVVVVLALALAGCGGAGGGSTDRSSGIAQLIQTQGAQQIQDSVNSQGYGGTVDVTDANCVETGSSQAYTCIAHYTYASAAGIASYEMNASASCDNAGNCVWHSDGPGTLTSQRAAAPAEGSLCTPPGGGSGTIVIEGPTAANPGHPDCVPQSSP